MEMTVASCLAALILPSATLVSNSVLSVTPPNTNSYPSMETVNVSTTKFFLMASASLPSPVVFCTWKVPTEGTLVDFVILIKEW